ncbi:M15 family metallopeptidase [Sphingobium boeckii]|uniref:D-alanyl-D-alanine carboxypeptidase n=1 Tax=Sphingobium boeckii TaxID=1082345 RepID=A0A7W9AEX8_9SPHN|nr:M15 family metallopeptidase [Sphingobium boeckii]MBB5684360.1 D-alanyl-D-alanine carboxypeptidase [Sphingobium boeckii]
MRAIPILGLSLVLGVAGGSGYALLFPSPVPKAVTVPIPAARPKTMASPTKTPVLCQGQKLQPPPVSPDGRLMNHFPYAEATPAELVDPPKNFGGAGCPSIHRDMLVPLNQMIAAAIKDDKAVGQAIMGVSCYRSIPRQADLFCRGDRIAKRGYAGQARWVAPPGYSEHSTGLTIDFGSRGTPKCHAETCFKDTRAGQWIARNARRYGFEMSFPQGNRQGVSPEPWHFRFVGTDHARAVFNAARRAN